jgi:hypothetical protein
MPAQHINQKNLGLVTPYDGAIVARASVHHSPENAAHGPVRRQAR